MSEPFIGEIKIFAGPFAPRNFAFCNGQTMEIADNTALFAVIGTYYGGDGRNTFALPEMRGRIPLHVGGSQNVGPGCSPHILGQFGGNESTILTIHNMPSHSHNSSFIGETEPSIINGSVKLNCYDGEAGENSPKGNYPANIVSETGGRGTTYPGYSSSANAEMAEDAADFLGSSNSAKVNGSVAIHNTGGLSNGNSAPFNILQPYTGLNFIIALEGIFPSRS